MQIQKQAVFADSRWVQQNSVDNYYLRLFLKYHECAMRNVKPMLYL